MGKESCPIDENLADYMLSEQSNDDYEKNSEAIFNENHSSKHHD